MEFVSPIKDKKKIDLMKYYLKSKNLRDYALFTLGINSALRVSDLLSLNVVDVIDEKGKIRDRIKLKEQKTGKTKNFPLSKNVVDALTEYINTLHPETVLFPSRKGDGSITRQHVHRILKEAAKAVGVKESVSTHSMRKSFSYALYESGVDITRIQALLNHSSPRETLRYIGITQSELDDVYLNLNL